MLKRKLITWIAFFLTISSMAQKQSHFDLFTDRDLFTSGETVLLKVFMPSSDFSSIVHLELLGKKGIKITGINLEVSSQQANGYIYLPDSLSSGGYLLRVSSRGATTSTFKEINVVNRFCNLAELGSSLQQTSEHPLQEKPTGEIEIKGVGEVFHTREKVICSVNLAPEVLQKLDGNLLISIAEESLSYPAKTFFLESGKKDQHLVESEGMIVEGIVRDGATNLPFRDAVVYFSIPDSVPDFNYYLTGQDGRFYFQLKKYFGKIPVVLQCFDPLGLKQLKISVLNPEQWDNKLPEFSERVFLSEYLKIASKNRDAVTYRKIYNQQEVAILSVSQPVPDAYPFFGVPMHTVFPKLFTDLPDFSEISRELLPGVKFRSYNRIPSVQVINAAMHAYPIEPPLVLLDGIPVRDLNLIKNLGTKDIDKVEICLSERFFGKINFPGVIAIHTSKAGYKALPETDELIKINLDAIQGGIKLYLPVNSNANEPDFRQVLLWQPIVQPHDSISVDFNTSDLKGRFRMIVRGKTKDGEILRNEKIFEVK